MLKSVVTRFSHAIGLHGEENKASTSEIENFGFGKLRTQLIYHRPLFLKLSVEEEKSVLNHKARRVIAPKNHTVIPFCSGYSEVVNAGKSILNEDCSVALTVVLDTLSKDDCTCKTAKKDVSSRRDFLKPLDQQRAASSALLKTPDIADGISTGNEEIKNVRKGSLSPIVITPSSKNTNPLESSKSDITIQNSISPETLRPGDSGIRRKSEAFIQHDNTCKCKTKTLRIDYFAIFDGHAGEGAAQYAAAVLHELLIERIREVQHLLLSTDSLNPIVPDCLFDSNSSQPQQGTATALQADSLITGLLQDVMVSTDKHMRADLEKFHINGGCTALLTIFILGKMFVAGAGDCRAVLCRTATKGEMKPTSDDVGKVEKNEKTILSFAMSQDFTPTTERRRLQYLAFVKPSLLGGHFTRLEFIRRLTPSDIGKKVLHRDYHMTGWVYKEIFREDLRHPMIAGVGKGRRLLATIGVSRGLGDHKLTALNQISNVPIKPFLSAVPEVRMYDLTTRTHGCNDVLVLGSDGLWDVLSNDEVANLVIETLEKIDENDTLRYTTAAVDLVTTARGSLLNGVWRMSDNKLASVDDITAFVIPLRAASMCHF